MATAPAFSGASQIPNQPTTARSNIHAFERPDGSIILVYGTGSGGPVEYQKYDPSLGTWSSPINVSTPLGLPSPRTGMLRCDADSSGNVMIVWNTQTGVGAGIVAILLKSDDSLATHNILAGPTAFPNSVAAKDNGVFVVATRSATDEISLNTYNPGANTWGGPVVEVDRSGVPASGISNVYLAHGAFDNSLHIVWSETTAAYTYYVAYTKVGSASVEIVSVQHATKVSLNPKIAVSRLDSDDVWAIFQRTVDPTGARITTVQRTLAGGWGAEVDLDVNADNADEVTDITVDSENTVHLAWQDDSGANPDEIYYTRIIAFGTTFETPVVQVSNSGAAKTSLEPFICRRSLSVSGAEMYIFWEDDSGVTALVAWWNVCVNCIPLPPSRYGTCINVEKNAALTTLDHYEIELGTARCWGGGPIVDGESGVGGLGSVAAVPPDGTLLLDKSYRIAQDGLLTRWGFRQEENTWVGTDAIGYVYLVIAYEDGADIKIRGCVPTDRSISARGLYEFVISPLAVYRNDIVGIWLASSAETNVGAQELISPPSTAGVYQWDDIILPGAGDTLPAEDSTEDVTLALWARSILLDDEQILQGYVSDGTNENAEGNQDFALATNAFADANVTNAANLFDDLMTTFAHVVASTVGNVYYNLDGYSELMPVERIEALFSVIPAGASFSIYISRDETAAKSLAGAQSISDWELLATIDENWVMNFANVTGPHIHVGRLAKWVRVEITGGSAAQVELRLFEIQGMFDLIIDGEFPPHPGAALLDRFWLDGDSHRWAPQRTATLLSAAVATDKVLYLDTNGDSQFMAQIETDDEIWVVDATTDRDDTSRMRSALVASKDIVARTITLKNQIGQAFAAGAKVNPSPIFIRAKAIDSAGAQLGRTPWIPIAGVVDRWARTRAGVSNPN